MVLFQTKQTQKYPASSEGTTLILHADFSCFLPEENTKYYNEKTKLNGKMATFV